jgi:hypothetical protein
MCKNCRDNYIAKATSNEISWQGDVVAELDVCIGDSLTQVGNIVLEKIKDLIKGKGIILSDLTISDCEYIEDLLDTDEKNLLNILRVYKEAICELKNTSDLTVANIQSFANTALYTLGCLPAQNPCSQPYTFKELIQAIITKLCTLNTQFVSIASTILDAIEEGAGNMLVGGSIKSCGNNGISFSGTGATAVVTFQALVPPNCPIVYTGSTGLPNFDVNGIGQPNTPYCGWYVCNGSNGTPAANTLPLNGGGTTKYIIRFT